MPQCHRSARSPWRLLGAPLTVLLATACQVSPPTEISAPDPMATDQVQQSVVYGEDDRLDYYEAPPAWQTVVERSIVALIQPGRVDDDDPANVQLSGALLGESLELCDDQRFLEHVRAASCSGTLIDDDLVLTAGHCLPNAQRCRQRRFVFGHYLTAEGTPAPVTADQIYDCGKLLATVDADGLDYALVRLDRPVSRPLAPAPVRLADEVLPFQTPITLIGFPNGIPAKVAANGAVVNPRPERLDFFDGSVDAFGGNSGSGVFNEAGEVVGILVRGARDYRDREGADCSEVNVLNGDLEEGDGAEDITYVARAIEHLCAMGIESERLCSGGGRQWCFPCEGDQDCAQGWRCLAHEGVEEEQVTFCAAPCDVGCRDDHVCQGGFCRPRLAAECQGDTVWQFDVCGRPVRQTVVCEGEDRCRNGICGGESPGDRCASAIEVSVESQRLRGDLTAEFVNDAQGSCGGEGPDQIYTFTLEAVRRFEARASGFDTLLHLRRGCEGEEVEEIACNDDHDPPGERGSLVEATLDPGTYHLFVDSFDEDVDSYTLDLEFGPPCPATCEAGSRRCDGDQAIACVRGPDGCPVEDEPEDCLPDGECIDGLCVALPPGDACPGAVPLPLEPVRLTGDLGQRYANDLSSTCGDGPDRLYTLEVPQETVLIARPEGDLTALAVRADCAEAEELACVVDGPLEATLGAGTWTLVLEGDGPYALEIEFAEVCQPDCERGATRCDAEGGFERCGPDVNGCPTWIQAFCPRDTVCEEGECVETMPDGGMGAGGAGGGEVPMDGGLSSDGGDEDRGGGGGGGCAAVSAEPAGSVWVWGVLIGLLGLRRRW